MIHLGEPSVTAGTADVEVGRHPAIRTLVESVVAGLVLQTAPVALVQGGRMVPHAPLARGTGPGWLN